MSAKLDDLYNSVSVNSIHALKGNGIDDNAGPILVHAGPTTVRVIDAGLLATARKIAEGRANTAPIHKIAVTSLSEGRQTKTNVAAVIAEVQHLG